jgi:hypothetical protein
MYTLGRCEAPLRGSMPVDVNEIGLPGHPGRHTASHGTSHGTGTRPQTVLHRTYSRQSATRPRQTTRRTVAITAERTREGLNQAGRNPDSWSQPATTTGACRYQVPDPLMHPGIRRRVDHLGHRAMLLHAAVGGRCTACMRRAADCGPSSRPHHPAAHPMRKPARHPHARRGRSFQFQALDQHRDRLSTCSACAIIGSARDSPRCHQMGALGPQVTTSRQPVGRAPLPVPATGFSNLETGNTLAAQAEGPRASSPQQRLSLPGSSPVPLARPSGPPRPAPHPSA